MGYRSSILMNMQNMGDMLGEMNRDGTSRRNSVNVGDGHAHGATVEAELSQELMETQVNCVP